jgi:1,2-diacylglycerol 3-beta-galactosyltransferase
VTFYILLLLKRTGLTVPLVTVVTDMVQGHHTWYQPDSTLCLVPTEEARSYALKFGLPPESVEVVGQPVTLKFKVPAGEKACLRGKLGLDSHRPTVLIAGGGEGFGPIFEIVRTVARQVPQAQLIVVTGRNKSLRQRLEARHWEIPTLIFGFVNNMPDLMGAADVFVTKAGPGSINEAFIARLPLILYHYIPGQERENVHYVEKYKAGIYVPHSEEVASLLAGWLQVDDTTLTEMTTNAASLARPEAVLTIARRIYTVAVESGSLVET